MSFGCHCERSVAIHAGMKSWIATAFGLAMTKVGRLAMTKGSGFAVTKGSGFAMTKVGRLAMTKGRTFLYAMTEPLC